MTERTYVFADTQQEHEWERLTAVQDVFDPITHLHLERLGVSSGWSCLEVGAGAGSIVRWLCDRVGESGRVVAVDLDPRFVMQIKRPQLDVRCLDIVTEVVEQASFDLVHARFVLMHIRNRKAAFSNMLRALKPGGWLLVEEPDFATALSTGEDSADNQAIERVFEATRHLYVSMGVDPFLGRKLPSIFQRLNLEEIDAKAETALLRGGSTRAKIWRMAVEHLREKLIDTKIPLENDLDQFTHLVNAPTTWALDYASVATWGQKSR